MKEDPDFEQVEDTDDGGEGTIEGEGDEESGAQKGRALPTRMSNPAQCTDVLRGCQRMNPFC